MESCSEWMGKEEKAMHWEDGLDWMLARSDALHITWLKVTVSFREAGIFRNGEERKGRRERRRAFRM